MSANSFRAVALPSEAGRSELRALAIRHAPGALVVLLLDLVLTRNLFGSGLPAGTDMLGLISRARQNASLGAVLSAWAPSALGSPRQFGLDNLLGALTMVTGSATLALKLAIVATLFVSGVAAYALTYRWYRRPAAAAIAGALYVLSEPTLGQWASGHLNVELLIAAAPLLVLLVAEAVERSSVRSAIALALVASFVVLVRPDLLLWMLPFLVLAALASIAASGRSARAWRSAGMALGVCAAIGVALGLYAIVGVLAGAKSPWATGSALFSTKDELSRSLDLYPSLIGIAREIGYFAFSGLQTWWSHPYLPLWLYWLFASVPVALAFTTVFWRRDHRTLYLLVTIVTASFLAKGIRSPVGGPYLWAVRHLPFFGNLRATDRWQIAACLACAVLSGVALEHGFRAFSEVASTRLTVLATATVTAVLVLPVLPTLASGLKTWQPDAGQRALLDRVAHDHGRFATASVPFGQATRMVEQGSYRGFEHDLGAESAAFTGHPSVGEGDWDQPLADLDVFETTLLRDHDPAFTRLLAASNVKYLFDFRYPETAPHLVPASVAAGRPIAGASSWWQQDAIPLQTDLQQVSSSSGGTLYSLRGNTPLLSVRPNSAVVLGGAAGVAALADLPGVHLGRWAPVLADDALRAGGIDRLLSLIRSSRLVVVANERPADVATLATPAIAVGRGFTSDPQLIRQTQNVSADLSTASGSLADVLQAPASPDVSAVSTPFTLSKPHTVALWTRAMTSRSPATLRFTVDGRLVRALLPRAAGTGFRWYDVGTLHLSAGSHVLEARAVRSSFGATYEIDETKVVRPEARDAVLTRLSTALRARAGGVVYALDLADSLKWAPLPLGKTALLTTRPAEFWRVADPQAVHFGELQPLVRITAAGGRRYYTLLKHAFSRPLDWRNVAYLRLTVRGDGTGAPLRLIVNFNGDDGSYASFELPDTDVATHDLALDAQAPDSVSGDVDWSHVTGLRVVADSKSDAVDYLVGAPGTVPNPPSVRVDYTLPGAKGMHQALFDETTKPRTRAMATGLSFAIPLHGAITGRLLLGRSLHVRELPAPAVSVRKTGPTSYAYTVAGSPRGTLVLAQAFDAHWHATHASAPLPVLSAETGFQLDGSARRGTIRFTPAGPVRGAIVASATLFALLAALVVAWPLSSGAAEAREARAPSRLYVTRPPGPRVLAAAGLALLALAAVVTAFGATGAANWCALGCLVFEAAALVLCRGARARPRGGPLMLTTTTQRRRR